MASGGNLLYNAGAFEKLIVDYEKYIFNLAYRMLGNVEDAKDVSQETMIKIYKNFDKSKEITAIKGWISTITTNACIDYLRKKKRFDALSIEAEIETEDGMMEHQLQSGDPTPEEQVVYRELRSDIAAALARQSDINRMLIVMRDIYGYSYNEIAACMDLQLGTVKSRLSRARNNLRREILQTEQKKQSDRLEL
jgi:RNA polymerase sigma-70 factor (ECF subfamily)